MVTMTSKFEFDRQMAFSKITYLGTVFVHNTAFPTAKMTKIMKILIVGPTISMSSSRYFSRVDLSVCKC